MKKNAAKEALKLAEQLGQIASQIKDPGLRQRALHLRDRIKTPMSLVLRKVPGSTIEEKCAKIGITRQNYYNWMRGRYRPNPKQAKKLAQLTGIDLADIRTSTTTEA